MKRNIRFAEMKLKLTVFVLIALLCLTLDSSLAQQQPIDTRQYATNPPQAPVGVPQLPEQRAYPKDSWGRSVLPGNIYRGDHNAKFGYKSRFYGSESYRYNQKFKHLRQGNLERSRSNRVLPDIPIQNK